MFFHQHPYPPFIPDNATKLIVGTLPPPRFSIGELHPKDVDFCYGSKEGQLWKIIDIIFRLDLPFENTPDAIVRRKKFLIANKIGICDIVAQCERKKIDASDVGMQNIVLRDLMGYLKQYTTVKMLLFTGGNSKNGPEYLFRKHLKEWDLKLKLLSDKIPRTHHFRIAEREIKTISLTAPSGAANRAVGSIPLYKELKKKDPGYSTIDFRVAQYEKVLKE